MERGSKNISGEPHDAIHSSEPNYIYGVTLQVSSDRAPENTVTRSAVLRLPRREGLARPEITISKVINGEAGEVGGSKAHLNQGSEIRESLPQMKGDGGQTVIDSRESSWDRAGRLRWFLQVRTAGGCS